MYAVYHGPEGLKQIAQSIHKQTLYLYKNLKSIGFPILNSTFFDTLTIQLKPDFISKIKTLTEDHGINLGYSKDNLVNISIGEGRTQEDMDELISIFKIFKNTHTNKFFCKTKKYFTL